ncbi:hypothetical protein [Caloramator sp. Dgby_cultured_2]|uniref:hypothetical protein n=1 Tax=Caloramator sp. Dgby_cultured_2 TaxID=3029174 RepID=UPI003159410B
MSIIETPPEDRYPVQTYVLEYNEAIVREAILREISRGGQVFLFTIEWKLLLICKGRYQSWFLRQG